MFFFPLSITLLIKKLLMILGIESSIIKLALWTHSLDAVTCRLCAFKKAES